MAEAFEGDTRGPWGVAGSPCRLIAYDRCPVIASAPREQALLVYRCWRRGATRGSLTGVRPYLKCHCRFALAKDAPCIAVGWLPCPFTTKPRTSIVCWTKSGGTAARKSSLSM